MGKLRLLDQSDAHAGVLTESHAGETGERVGGAPREIVEGVREEVLKTLISALLRETEGPPVTGERFGRERAAAWEQGGLNYYEEVRGFEVALITWALERTRGHQTAAAKLLGMSVSTLNMKIKQFNIPVVRATAVRHA
jgi:DNA-binding NtrC family response regulator